MSARRIYCSHCGREGTHNKRQCPDKGLSSKEAHEAVRTDLNERCEAIANVITAIMKLPFDERADLTVFAFKEAASKTTFTKRSSMWDRDWADAKRVAAALGTVRS